MHSPCTDSCSLSSLGPHLGLLWAGANFRLKGYVQSCSPAFHLSHKQCCAGEKGSFSCYRMALFLFPCLCYWAKVNGRGVPAAHLAHGSVRPGNGLMLLSKCSFTNCQVKFYSSWRKPYKTIIMVSYGRSRTFSPPYVNFISVWFL